MWGRRMRTKPILALASLLALAPACGSAGKVGSESPDGGRDGSSGRDGEPPSEASTDARTDGGQTLWYKFLGDGAYEDVGGVATDANGNVFYAGYFQGTIDFGGGPLTATGMSSDIYLAKYDSTGKYLWAARYGDAQVQVATGIAVDAQGDVIVTGTNAGVVDFGNATTPLTTAGLDDVIVAKFDPTGKALWAKDYGDAQYQEGYSVAVDSKGDVALTGAMQGTTTFGNVTLTSAGGYDIFVAELDPTGTTLWAKNFGDASDQFGIFVAFDPAGDVVLTADFAGSVNVGTGALTSAGMDDVLLAKLSPTGTALFGKSWGDPMDQVGDCVAVDPAGEIVLSGGFDGTFDFGKGPMTATDEGAKYLAKFDANGNALWSKSFGDGTPSDWTALAVDGTGGPVIVGEFIDAIDFGQGPLMAADKYDIFVARFDTSGRLEWGNRYGAIDNQLARAVALDPKGDVVVGGYFLGKLGFTPGTGETAPGNGLLYLVSFSP
jgi:hypothetical protein